VVTLHLTENEFMYFMSHLFEQYTRKVSFSEIQCNVVTVVENTMCIRHLYMLNLICQFDKRQLLLQLKQPKNILIFKSGEK